MIGTIEAPAAGSSALSTSLPFIGQGIEAASQWSKASPHNNANTFVQNYENQLGAALQQASALANTNPDQARQILSTAYAKYIQGLQLFKSPQYANFGGMGTIADQSLSNQALQNTLRSVSQALGVSVDPTSDIQADPATLASKFSIPMQGVSGNASGGVFGEQVPTPPTTPAGVGIKDILASTLPAVFGSILKGTSNAGASPGPTPNIPVAPTAPKSIFDTLLPYIVSGGISTAGNIYSADAASNASQAATKMQTDAATHAADTVAATAANNLALQKQIYQETVARQQPWLDTGTAAINKLGFETGVTGDPNAPGYGDLTKPYDKTFNFTADDLLKDPGYLNRLSQSQIALDREAASKGGLFTPGTVAAIGGKIGDQASNEFSAAYDRAHGSFLDQYNIDTANKNRTYNELAGIAGTGQTTNQSLQSAGSMFGNAADTTSTNATNGINDANIGGANAGATGITNQATAKIGGVNNTVDDITTLLAQLIKAGKLG
jgi:hypothetical protein